MNASTTLSSWAATLSFLDSGLASSLEPLARRLDLVMQATLGSGAGDADPNGYDGLDRRGSLDRLLLGDWMLADEEPDEFVRRFATAELSYLRVDYRPPRPSGRIIVLLDAGPTQIGSRRLVHLAALAVLHRRATGGGVPLYVGTVADPAGNLHANDLPELYEFWAAARTPHQTSTADLERWAAALEASDHVWLLGGTGLECPTRLVLHRLWAEESAWGPEGATRLQVQVDHRSLEIELPPATDAVRLLRGEGLKRSSNPAVAGSSERIRFPRLPGAARRLVWRGEDDRELRSIALPQQRGDEMSRPKRRRFQGPVLAAGFVGSRLVALVVVGGRLRIEVVGKRLGNVAAIDAPLETLGLEAEAPLRIAAEGLEPLHFQSGAVLARVAGSWWRLDPRGVQPATFEQVLATPTVDRPLVCEMNERAVFVDGRPLPPPTGPVVLGSCGRFAIERGPGLWRIGDAVDVAIRVDERASVIGLTHVGAEPALVTLSRGGQLLRLHRPSGLSTLTAFSSDIDELSLHPTEPLLAIRRGAGAVDIVDLERSELLVHLKGDE